MDAKKQIPFQRDQMTKIVDVLGFPSVRDWPGITYLPEFSSLKALDSSQPYRLVEWCQSRVRSQQGYELLRLLFAYDPDKRLSAEAAIRHAWFLEDPKPTWNAFQSLNSHQIPPHRRITQDDVPSMVPSLHNTQHGGLAQGPFGSKPGSSTSLSGGYHGSQVQVQGNGGGSRKKARIA
jgi:cyclin-dependent kinase 8/11